MVSVAFTQSGSNRSGLDSQLLQGRDSGGGRGANKRARGGHWRPEDSWCRAGTWRGSKPQVKRPDNGEAGDPRQWAGTHADL